MGGIQSSASQLDRLIINMKYALLFLAAAAVVSLASARSADLKLIQQLARELHELDKVEETNIKRQDENEEEEEEKRNGAITEDLETKILTRLLVNLYQQDGKRGLLEGIGGAGLGAAPGLAGGAVHTTGDVLGGAAMGGAVGASIG